MGRIRLAAVALVAACSASLGGPTPIVQSVSPAVICTAQFDNTITLTGSGFSPVVQDGLTSAPSVLMPRVFLVDGAGVEVEIPPAGVSLPDTTGTLLDVIVPMGLVGPTTPGPAQVYDVRVVNPNGREGLLAGALTVVPPPDLVAVDPTSGAVGTTVTVTLTGDGFLPGMTVTLDANPAVNGANVVVASPTGATADFDLTGVAPGTYDVTVTNADGCSDTLPGAFTVYQPNYFTITGIDPPFGCTCSTTTVTITSASGFVSTPRVEMRPHGMTTPVLEFERVAFVDANTLTAVVPAGAALGDQDVTVLNPPSDGGIGILDNGFRVVAMPVPTIEAIVPSRGDPSTDTPVSIFGENFRDPVKIELIDRAGLVVGTVAMVTPVSSTQIDATLPTLGMAQDAYLVRVTNLDEMTYSTFSSFIVGSIGPSGNLHPFVGLTSLNDGRRMLAGASGRDELGNTYLYAVGGDTGAGGVVLPTVEVSPLAKFGNLGGWTRLEATPLAVGRAGAAAVVVPVFDPTGSPFVPLKSYLYVLGGRDDAGVVTESIERAMVLRAADAPRITSIAASPAAGNLAAGTWYYKVSAVLAAADPDNPGGETLASDEAILSIGGGTMSIDLAWDPVMANGMPAASYRVYRTDAVDGASQTEHLIATVTTTSYTDAGAAAGTENPLPGGALGVWVTLPGTLAAARWGHQGALVTDVNGDRFLYVVGGKSDAAAGYLGSVEWAAVDDQGTVQFNAGAFDTSGTADMTPRAFFALAVETQDDVSGFTAGARLFALGGVAAGGASDVFEMADVSAGGGNAAWVPYGGAGGLGSRAGAMSVIAGEKLFTLGGAGTATDTTFGNILMSGRDVPFLADGTIGTPIQSTAEALLTPRALGAAIVGAGFIYFVGGTSDGTNAVATTEQTF